MLDATTIDALTIGCVAVGSILWGFAPLAERYAGDQGAVAFLTAGLSLFISALAAVGLPVAWTDWVRLIPWLPIYWGALAYLMFELVFVEEIPKEPDWPPEQHCVPKLEYGSQYSPTPYRRRTLRTHLQVRARVFPSSCDLKTSAWAWGRAYYGFFYLTGKGDLSPTVNVVCQKLDNACTAIAVVQGRSQITDGPVTLQVDHTISPPAAALVSVRTVITAAVGASGGPGISLGYAGVTGSASPVNSARGFREEMGTFVWRCVSG